MQVEKIKINLLGGFSVWVNGMSVVKDAAKLTKPWQLFCYLVLHREKFISNRKLISVLWVNDLLTDPTNVLKNAVYSLRKELCGGESSTESPIIYSTGGYRIDPKVELELDIDVFSQMCEDSKSATGEQRKELCRKAVQAYKGDFLPQLDQELWVVSLALEYRRKYLDCVHVLCEYLWKNEEYKELLDVASNAIIIDSLDEKNNIYLFRAMDELKMYRVIVTTYSHMAQRYDDALGGEPPLETRSIYHAASERINKTEQDIIVIKSEISSGEFAARPQRGAYFCSYSTLRHMYSIMRRAADRNKHVLVLALFTLSITQEDDLSRYDMVRAMAEMKVVAMNNLRKADAFSRYSQNQYVMLLSVTSLEDGRLVRDRIRKGFLQSGIGRKINVDVKLTEI